MSNYNKITALYSRLSVGDEDRDGGESNSIQNQKIFLENYAKGQHLTNIRHYIDDDESGRFFDRSAYSRMIEDVESGKIGVCIMKDLTRWGRDYATSSPMFCTRNLTSRPTWSRSTFWLSAIPMKEPATPIASISSASR